MNAIYGKDEKTFADYVKDARNFGVKYPNIWHGFSKDALTKRVIGYLEIRGELETNEYRQFKYHVMTKE